jgi:TP901 family phage tail tape measure protein
MANRFSVDTVFRGIDQMSGMFGPMTAKAKAFEKSLQSPVKAASELVEKPLGLLKKVGAVTVATGIAAGAVFTDLVGTGADFEKTMIAAGAKFSPAIRQGTKEFAELQAKAEEVGAKTEFNAQQAAVGLKNLASAGFNAKQAIAALPGVVDLATASEVDLTAASEMATKSLGAFNLKTDDATQLGMNLARVNDVMSRTADATSASMEGLFQSILEGGPVATTAGASVETFMALAGQLAQSGIEASVAGTTLKNVFLTLAAPSKEAASALSTLGIKTEDAKGNMKDAVALLSELEQKTAKMGTAKKADVIESIFGKIPIAGVSALLGGGIDKVAALRKELENAGGSTARMAAIMRDSTQNDIDGFTSAIDGVKIAIFNVAKGPLRGIIQSVTDWTTANQAFIATRFDEFLNNALPIVENFGDGVKDSFADAKPVIDGVADALLGVFGGDGDAGPRMQAYQLANTVTDLTLTLGGLWLTTKAVSAATFVYGAVTKGLAAAVWLCEVAVGAAKTALIWYNIWTKAGTASTIALSGANVIAAGNLMATRVAAFAAAGGFTALAGAIGVAGVAYLSYLAIKEANDDLKKQTGGLGIVDLTVGALSGEGGFFTQADANLDKQAKEEARKRDAAAKGGAAGAATDPAARNPFDMSGDPASLMKQLAAINAASGVLPPGVTPPHGAVGAVPAPAPAPGSKTAEPQVALKDESSAKLSQNLSRDIATNLKGSIKIEIKDKGGNADVSQSTGPGVEVLQSGGF